MQLEACLVSLILTKGHCTGESPERREQGQAGLEETTESLRFIFWGFGFEEVKYPGGGGAGKGGTRAGRTL